MAGEDACDRTPWGSYASTAIMLKNIQKRCANCGEKIKMDAAIYADDTIRRVIDPDAYRRMKEDFAL